MEAASEKQFAIFLRSGCESVYGDFDRASIYATGVKDPLAGMDVSGAEWTDG